MIPLEHWRVTDGSKQLKSLSGFISTVIFKPKGKRNTNDKKNPTTLQIHVSSAITLLVVMISSFQS